MTDTSELYRTMCLTPEIQKGHEWQEGDWRFNMATGATICTTHTDIKIGIYKSNEFLPDIRWYLEHINACPIAFYREGNDYWGCLKINDKEVELNIKESAEQVMLTMYMYANGKTWNGKEWV